MKNLTQLLNLALTIISITACTFTPAQRPDDFSLSFSWNTGSLPPQYHYTYTITIDSGGKGEFTYQPGYEQDEVDLWQITFTLTAQEMDNLYQYIAENELMRSSWKEGKKLLGGSGTSMRITADGKEYHVPSISEVTDDDRTTINAAMDYINNLVPKNIWDEMNARQQEYSESFDEE